MNVVIVGHVDHGKSTVIGRLLVDTGSLPKGKLQQVRELCERNSKPFEFAFLLDALKDEQAQGITIDSARVFFKSEKRSYIIIDAPGHIEFLKSMVTGASRAEAALLIIDASEGIQENSRRHAYMLSMLGIQQVVVLVNKMDLIKYNEKRYQKICEEFRVFLGGLGISDCKFIPVSGREGDNIALPSSKTPWFKGSTVLEALDNFESLEEDSELPFRMPVQGVYKFTQSEDSRRIIAGTVNSGTLSVGDEVVFYPSEKSSRVKTIERFPEDSEFNGPVGATEAIGFTLEEQLYVKRGDLVARKEQKKPKVSSRLKVILFWLGRQPLKLDKEILLRVGTSRTRVRLESISKLINSSSLEEIKTPTQISCNEIAEGILSCDQEIPFDIKGGLTKTCQFVLIEDFEISGGGLIQEQLGKETPEAQKKTPYESTKRSMIKALSYRVWATVVTAILVLLVTGSFKWALGIGVLDIFSKMALYFMHERFWQRISYGKR